MFYVKNGFPFFLTFMCGGGEKNVINIFLFLFCKITNKSTITINSQIITLLHVSTLSCHLQTARIQYLAKLHKYIHCSCWQYNLN